MFIWPLQADEASYWAQIQSEADCGLTVINSGVK